MKSFITNSPNETKKLGEGFARKVRHGGIIALQGELGSGKTTFVQGFLKRLRIKGPYTSPTFVVIKHYRPVTQSLKPKTQSKKGLWVTGCELWDIYHVDAYRVNAKNVLSLGWEEIIADKNNIIIIEWADRIKKIIPKNCLWIIFKWIDNNTRKIILKS